jgi:hypothetical protein
MRTIFALPLLLAASACNVSQGDNGVTVQYDQNTAEDAVADVTNTAQNVGGIIVNDVQATGEKVQEKVGNADVDVDVDTNAQSNTQ